MEGHPRPRPPPARPPPPRPARPPASVAPVHDHILHVFSSCKEGPGDLPLGARRGGLTPPFDAAAAPDQRVLSQKMAEKPPMPGWRGNYLAARRPREASEPRLHRRLQEKDKQVLASGEASPTRRKMPARHLNSDGPFYPRSRRPPFGPRAGGRRQAAPDRQMQRAISQHHSGMNDRKANNNIN